MTDAPENDFDEDAAEEDDESQPYGSKETQSPSLMLGAAFLGSMLLFIFFIFYKCSTLNTAAIAAAASAPQNPAWQLGWFMAFIVGVTLLVAQLSFADKSTKKRSNKNIVLFLVMAVIVPLFFIIRMMFF